MAKLTKGQIAARRTLNIACDVEFQAGRFNPKILATADGDMHAAAITVSVLECLRGHAFEGPVTGAELQLAINAFCHGAGLKQVKAGSFGDTFRLVRGTSND